MELTKQSSGLLCKLVIYYDIFVIYYYIFHDRSNASIAGDRDLRSPAIDALLSVAPAHPARNLDMHLCWHVHPSNVKNLVVDEEKSVLNHQTHNACQTEDQCQSGARRGYAYRAPHITAVPRAQHTYSSCSGSKRNAHLNSGSSRPIRTSARLRPCRASSARICRDRDRVCAKVKKPLAKGARACAGRFAPHAPGRQISNASVKIIVAAGLSKIEV